MSNTAKKYGRTYRKPAAIPYGTTVEDADGFELVRGASGWTLVDEDSAPIGTADLAFPVRVILERSGDRKPRGQDRPSRRWRQKELAKAKAAKVVRQVHAAEENREKVDRATWKAKADAKAASRREALEDRDRARNGEEVGA